MCNAAQVNHGKNNAEFRPALFCRTTEAIVSISIADVSVKRDVVPRNLEPSTVVDDAHPRNWQSCSGFPA